MPKRRSPAAAPAVPSSPGLTVEMMALSSIKPYHNNPRRNEASIAKTAASIREFGFRQPIVVDEAMVIIAGHTRRLAAMQLGLVNVPVHVARGMSPEKVRAYRLADNRTAEDAAWDPDALKHELELVRADGLLDVTGFDDPELEALLGLPSGLRPGVDPDDAPDLPAAPKSKLGQMYVLGAHRLLCGDCRVADNWARLMGDDRADALITDPPYGVRYEGGTARKLKIQNDNLGHEGTLRFLRAYLGLALAYARDGAPMYVFAPHGPEFWPFAKVGMELAWWHQTIVWAKDAFALGRSDYHYRHEAILAGMKVPVLDEEKPAGEAAVVGYGWKPGAKHPWEGDRRQDTVWEFPRPRRNAEHPTMKPVGLIQRAIRNSTALGAVIVDGCAGSGTALVAAEATGRRALLMENDPAYVDVILERFAQATGQTPALVEA